MSFHEHNGYNFSDRLLNVNLFDKITCLLIKRRSLIANYYILHQSKDYGSKKKKYIYILTYIFPPFKSNDEDFFFSIGIIFTYRVNLTSDCAYL